MSLIILNKSGRCISTAAKDTRDCEKIAVSVKRAIIILALFSIVMMMGFKHIPQKPATVKAYVQEAASAVEVLFDIPKIAGKTEAEVEVLLGEPVFCSKPGSTLNCSYQDNEIEIVFIDGKADWITVYGAFRSPSYHQKIVGKTKAEALKLLGEPAFCVKSKPAMHCAFREGDVSVEFIDGKVDEITVKGNLGKAAYSKDTLAMLGLPVKDAVYSNNKVMHWENISGLLGVTLHAAGNNVSVVTIKAKTK
ncbi:MAG: hypothetical protein ISR72_08900 [Methylobacter sp.]|nr:hypothetical protein [Methylobacter sp.]